MSKKAFKIEGDFQMGRARQTFAVEMVGADEADARDHLMKDLGSRHGVARRDIAITAVSELAAADTSAVTQRRLARE